MNYRATWIIQSKSCPKKNKPECMSTECNQKWHVSRAALKSKVINSLHTALVLQESYRMYQQNIQRVLLQLTNFFEFSFLSSIELSSNYFSFHISVDHETFPVYWHVKIKIKIGTISLQFNIKLV